MNLKPTVFPATTQLNKLVSKAIEYIEIAYKKNSDINYMTIKSDYDLSNTRSFGCIDPLSLIHLIKKYEAEDKEMIFRFSPDIDDHFLTSEKEYELIKVAIYTDDDTILHVEQLDRWEK